MPSQSGHPIRACIPRPLRQKSREAWGGHPLQCELKVRIQFESVRVPEGVRVREQRHVHPPHHPHLCPERALFHEKRALFHENLAHLGGLCRGHDPRNAANSGMSTRRITPTSASGRDPRNDACQRARPHETIWGGTTPCSLISPCRSRDCVKSLRSPYIGLYPQKADATPRNAACLRFRAREG